MKKLGATFFIEKIEQQLKIPEHIKNNIDANEAKEEETNSITTSLTKDANMLSMFDDSTLSNIEFLVEDAKITAHRVILYARSHHFRQMFDNGMRERYYYYFFFEMMK